jgi:amidase
MSKFAVLAAAAALAFAAEPAQAQPLSPYASAGEQQAAMKDGRISSEALVRAYFDRIAEIDRAGPKLNSVIALSPRAITEARRLDAERAAGKLRGPLHGVPVLLKDNIEADIGLPTTAGSLALADNVTGRDAPLVKRLTDAGAVILGKTNLSEWANFRSTRSISGWSAVGGLVRNPYSLDRTACGSSSGSGAAIAAGIGAVAIGTETNGSITCPAAMTGVVGLKPTVGLVSRTHIVPISPTQDTAGPMTRTVADAAAVLTVIAGSDPADPATAQADARKADYLKALDRNALKGQRIGVWNPMKGRLPELDVAFDKAVQELKAAGAELVEVAGPAEPELAKIGSVSGDLLRWEFKAALDAYLATTPPAVKARTLDALIAFNKAEPRELALFGQEIFEQSAKTPPASDKAMQAKRAEVARLSKAALDKMLAENKVVALVSPSGGPAAIVDPVAGGRFFGSPSTLPAVSGYPHLTVPMGNLGGLPVGISFIGPAWSEARLLALGFAYEQTARARREPDFLPSLAKRPDIAEAYDPR